MNRQRVAIIGTRESRPAWWQNVSDVISSLGGDPILVTGDCPTGIDKMVRTIAIDRGYSLVVFHARWGAKGKAAGPERNQLIVDFADFVIAMPGPVSSGTWDVVRKGEVAKKPLTLIRLLDSSGGPPR